jgi:hypothetical protein
VKLQVFSLDYGFKHDEAALFWQQIFMSALSCFLCQGNSAVATAWAWEDYI